MSIKSLQKNIPNGWNIKQIKDICENLDNKRIPITKEQREKGEIPYYGATGIVDYVSGYIFDEELLLVGEDGADWSKYANTSFIISDKSWVNNHAHVLRCVDINPVFLKEYLNYSDLNFYISGGTRGKLTKGVLEKIPILLPTPEEQKKIAEILSKVDEEINKTDELISKTGEIKRGVFREFLNQDKNTKDWKIRKIKELLDFEQPNNYIVENENYNNEFKIPVLTANKSFILGYTNETFGIYKNIPVIIFDDFTTDSKFVNFPFKIKSSAIKILKNKENVSDIKFVYEVMKSINFPIANHKRHYISQYQELEILTPSLSEQKRISKILEFIDKKLDKQKELKEKLIQLKKGLMSDLLSGKVRVK